MNGGPWGHRGGCDQVSSGQWDQGSRKWAVWLRPGPHHRMFCGGQRSYKERYWGVLSQGKMFTQITLISNFKNRSGNLRLGLGFYQFFKRQRPRKSKYHVTISWNRWILCLTTEPLLRCFFYKIGSVIVILWATCLQVFAEITDRATEWNSWHAVVRFMGFPVHPPLRPPPQLPCTHTHRWLSSVSWSDSLFSCPSQSQPGPLITQLTVNAPQVHFVCPITHFKSV